MKTINYILINGKQIGPGRPTYIVAEMSANHNQDFDQAVLILKKAKEAGADAVKIQTYTPQTLTINCDNEYFSIGNGTIWAGQNLYQLYEKAFTPWEWQPQLKAVAHELGIDFFSTPFDTTAVDFLEDLDLPAYKVASFELVDLQLVKRIAETGKPVILSTGMADLSEIGEAVQLIRSTGNHQLALLKCTSAYPAAPEDINLRTMAHLQATFGVPVGLSDHTLGITVPVVAVALGASIVEKHFTLSRDIPGPDATFSLEPHEFRQMVDSIRMAEKALGKVSFAVTRQESASRIFRRSLFVVEQMKQGDVFTRQNIRSIRPGYGMHTRHFEEILGRKASRDIERGTPLAWDLVGDV